MTLNDLQSGRNTLGALVGGGLALWLTWLAGTILGMLSGNAITDPKALGVDMVMGCFMLSMVLAGRRTSRTVVAWVVGGAAAYAAWTWLPENSHIIINNLTNGLVGALWLEDKA
jgi:predicted branched-subunit amino acid permease